MFVSKDAAPGVRVVSVATDKFKTDIVEISVAVPHNENAAANALLAALLTRTCKAYPDFTKLNAKLDELYGANVDFYVSKVGDAQVLSFNASCLDDRFALDGESVREECVKLLSGMLFEPNVKNNSFGKEALAVEKRLLINNIKAELDDKRNYAVNKCIELMCAGEPFGRPACGTIEEVESVRMSDVYAAWKNILRTGLFHIVAVGNYDADKLSGIFAEKFAKIDREPCEINTVFLKKGLHFKRGVEQFPMKQGKLVFGFRAGMEGPDDNLPAVKVMVDIFGGGTYSKLFANVREKMSLAYYCSARLIESKGIVLVQSGIDTEKEKQVSTAIINQLDDMRNGKFDDETIAASKLSLRERLTLTTPWSICAWYKSFVRDEEIKTPEEVADSYESVTKEDICEAAKKLSIDKIYMLEAVESEAETVED